MVEIFFPSDWKGFFPKGHAGLAHVKMIEWMQAHMEFNMGRMFFVRDTGQLIWMAKVV